MLSPLLMDMQSYLAAAEMVEQQPLGKNYNLLEVENRKDDFRLFSILVYTAKIIFQTFYFL